jgi:hypothetical protein
MSIGIRLAQVWAPDGLSVKQEWRFVEPYSLIDFATAFHLHGGAGLGVLKVRLPTDSTDAERALLIQLGAEIL